MVQLNQTARKVVYDLHTHSDHSDGNLPYGGLMRLAKESGLKGIAVTDHVRAGPIARIAQAANENGLIYVPGVELMCNCKAQIMEFSKGKPAPDMVPKIELVVYGIGEESGELKELTGRYFAQREEFIKALVEMLSKTRLSEIGYAGPDGFIELDLNEALARMGTGFKSEGHIMDMLSEKYGVPRKGAMRDFVMHRSPKNMMDAFFGINIEDMLAKAKKWGKFVSLAHPFTTARSRMGAFYEQVLIPRLAKAGLDAIEAYYPEHSPGNTEHAKALADRHGLLVTGGSDFHSEGRGDVIGACGVTEQEFLSVMSVIRTRS